MLVEKTNMMVTKITQTKKGKGESVPLITHVHVQFDVQRAFMDRLIPDQKGRFSEQFWDDSGDVRLQQVYPINMGRVLQEMRVGIYFGSKPVDFKPASVGNITMEPIPAGYVHVKAVLYVNPTAAEAGKLDMLINEVVPIEIEALNVDIEDAGSDTTDSE